jgi:PAS domain S-box-containing protein
MTKQVILCVDDEVMVLDGLKAELREAIGDDYWVEVAEDGEDALELFENLLKDGYEIPLIISDYIMPGMKGDELLKQTHSLSSETLKVLLTGQASLEAIGNTIQSANLYRYIAKPWQSDDLQLTVKEAINSYRQSQQLAKQTAQLQQTNQFLQELNREQAALIEALQKTEEKYRGIFENALEGIFQSTPDGRFLNVNPALATLYGYASPQELVMTVTDIQHQIYVEPDRRHEFMVLMQQYDAVTEFESQVYRQDGSVIWISENARAVRDANGEILCYQGFIVDITKRKQAEQLLASYNQTLEKQVVERTLELQQEITDRKQAEEAIQESEARFRQLAEATFEAIVVVEDGRIVDTNQTFAQMFGYEQSEVIGMATTRFVPAEYQDVCAEKMQLDEDVYENICLRKDGTTFSAEVRMRNITQGDRTIWIAAVRDITNRKQMEEASVLEERNRIAREIHDTLAQAFTGIVIQLEAISRMSTVISEEAQLCLIQIYDLARSGLNEARRSVKALRPQLLEEGNLCSALDRLTTTMGLSPSTQLVCQVRGTVYSLPVDVENNLLRIGQEALMNATKHANASEIKIELVYEQVRCILRVKDNGQGFTMSNLSTHQGFGLIGMQERANRINAYLTIQSQPGQGAEVVVWVNRE